MIISVILINNKFPFPIKKRKPPQDPQIIVKTKK